MAEDYVQGMYLSAYTIQKLYTRACKIDAKNRDLLGTYAGLYDKKTVKNQIQLHLKINKLMALLKKNNIDTDEFKNATILQVDIAPPSMRTKLYKRICYESDGRNRSRRKFKYCPTKNYKFPAYTVSNSVYDNSSDSDSD